jgi:hypothetical protein
MRSSFWVVLCLVGAVPLGALAQEAQEQPAGQARAPEGVSSEALQQQINELWQSLRMLQQELAEPREEGPGARAAEEDTGFIIVELPEPAGPGLSGEEASGPASRAGIGGSGPGSREREQAGVPRAADIYVGTVRALTGDRLLMEERTGYVYELGVDERTRIIGPEGGLVSPRALEEGTPVRVVATEGEERDRVHRLYILAPLPVPER